MKNIIIKMGFLLCHIITLHIRLRLKSCGRDVFISPFVRIKSPRHVSIGDNVRLIGRGYIQGRGGLHIESNTSLAEGFSILTLEHGFKNSTQLPYDARRILRPVTIGAQTWVGRNVLILPGTTVGEGCIIAAGSVIRGQIPPLSIMAGNPAKKISSRDPDEYSKLKAQKLFFKIPDSIRGGWIYTEEES